MRSHRPITSFTSCSISRIVLPSAADLVEQLAQLDLLGRVHAGGRFVEREQLRIGGQRARDLQTALVAVRQVARRVVGELRDADVVEQFLRALADLALFLGARPACGTPRRSGPCCVRTWRPTITFSSAVMLAEQADVLERARDAGLGHLVHGGRRVRLAVELEAAASRACTGR